MSGSELASLDKEPGRADVEKLKQEADLARP
jgi:hypothetical protein